MGCAASASKSAAVAPDNKDEKLQRGGVKLLEFKVKGSKPGREFSAEISLLGGGVSVAAQFAKKEHLPIDWQHYSVYAAKVIFEYHNDEGEGSDIRIDPAMGVRLLGEDILPSAALLGCDWAPDNPRWQSLREAGNMAWKGRYEMSTPVAMETCSQRQLLEFKVALPLEMETLAFEVEQVKMSCQLQRFSDVVGLPTTPDGRYVMRPAPSEVQGGSAPVPDNVARNFLKALDEEYVQGAGAKVGEIFEREGHEETLLPFEETVRAASEGKRAAIEAIARSWGLEQPPKHRGSWGCGNSFAQHGPVTTEDNAASGQMRSTLIAAFSNLSTAYNLVNINVSHVILEGQYCGGET
eukprot:s4887_g2.t1